MTINKDDFFWYFCIVRGEATLWHRTRMLTAEQGSDGFVRRVLSNPKFFQLVALTTEGGYAGFYVSDERVFEPVEIAPPYIPNSVWSGFWSGYCMGLESFLSGAPDKRRK